MGKMLASDVEDLVHRAGGDTPIREHRYVYDDYSATSPPRVAIRPNKKAIGRRVSTFYLIVLLFGFGIATVAYVSNIIAVNRLAAEINQLQAQYVKISNSNAVLRAEINRKSAWERIGKIANDQIGLRYVKEQPTLFDVDEDLMEQARTKASAK
jgi:cell division protein FtsL